MASVESTPKDPSSIPAGRKRRVPAWLTSIAGIAAAACLKWLLCSPALRKDSRSGESPKNSLAGATAKESAESATMDLPVDPVKKRTSWVRVGLSIVVVLAVSYCLLRLVVLGIPYSHEDDPMHFKYGSIGSDNLRRGIPYEIWRVLPDMFCHHLPKRKPINYEAIGPISDQRDGEDCPEEKQQNYEAFGLIRDERDRQDRPIGFSKRWHLGVGDVIGLNCAFCHVSTLRKKPGGVQEIILGMPANTVDAEGFFQFLFKIADDPKFTVENVLIAIKRKREKSDEGRLGYWGTFIQRRVVIPVFIRGLKNLKHTFSFLDRRPTPFGPGRVDTWAAYKVLALQEPFWFMEYLPEWSRPYIHMDAGPVTGLADFPALWKEKAGGGAFHWDGNNRVPEERNITAALGAGVTPATLDLDSLRRIARWMESELKPLAYHDLDLMGPPPTGDYEHGRFIFRRLCYDCHAKGGARIKLLEPVDVEGKCKKDIGTVVVNGNEKSKCEKKYIGTDPERLQSFTKKLSDKLNEVRHLSVWGFKHYRKTNGYANMLLTGIWLRAPYLHNGSVPTLWHLLQKPENRPMQFCRGNDAYDWYMVGFEWRPGNVDPNEKDPNPCGPFHYYDTKLPGNGNGGHSYGKDLSGPEKEALIEYLKTL